MDEAAVHDLTLRGVTGVAVGDLVVSRWCADEDIAELANQIRALTNRPDAHP